jgi:hypothetical protein
MYFHVQPKHSLFFPSSSDIVIDLNGLDLVVNNSRSGRVCETEYPVKRRSAFHKRSGIYRRVVDRVHGITGSEFVIADQTMTSRPPRYGKRRFSINIVLTHRDASGRMLDGAAR